jgi:hypothetical protein
MGFDETFSKGPYPGCFAKSNVVVVTSHIAGLLEFFFKLGRVHTESGKCISCTWEYGRIVKFLRKFDDRICRVQAPGRELPITGS